MKNLTSNRLYIRFERLQSRHTARPYLKVILKQMQQPRNAFIFDRHHDLVNVRQVICYILNKHTDLTHRQIGYIISPDDSLFNHSTITHSIGVIEKNISFIGKNGNSRPVDREIYKTVKAIELKLVN